MWLLLPLRQCSVCCLWVQFVAHSRLDDEEYRNKSERIHGETRTTRVYSSSDSQDPIVMLSTLLITFKYN